MLNAAGMFLTKFDTATHFNDLTLRFGGKVRNAYMIRHCNNTAFPDVLNLMKRNLSLTICALLSAFLLQAIAQRRPAVILPPNIDSAIAYMEKCKALEPYYCPNFFNLGEAYNYNRNYEKAIGILDELAKLPNRRQDDLAVKKDGAALRQKLQ